MSKRLKRQVIGAVPWSIAEGLVNGLAGLALTFVLAWFFEPTEVGQATIALAIVGVIEIIAGIGLVEAFIGARSGDTLVSDTAFTAVFSLAVVAVVVCWFLAGPIGRFYDQPHVSELLQVAALILPVNAIAAIPTGLLVRKMRAAVLTLRMTTGRVVTIAIRPKHAPRRPAGRTCRQGALAVHHRAVGPMRFCSEVFETETPEPPPAPDSSTSRPVRLE